MVLEYLFQGTDKRKELLNVKHESAVLKIEDIENSDLWIAAFSIDGENLKSSKKLSNINEYIISHFDCTTLTNEASQYFNKSLFPSINEFERKLRKLLYLVSKKSSKTDASENIKDLESMDLGSIFDLIFTDKNYIRNAKITLNDKTWKFTKRELIQALSGIKENPLWNSILGNDVTPTFCNNFLTIKSYRNDVMHAHNINYNQFKDAKKLYNLINRELSDVINSIKTNPVTNGRHEKSDNSINDLLREAIEAQKATVDLSFSALNEIKEAAGKILSSGAFKEMQEAANILPFGAFNEIHGAGEILTSSAFNEIQGAGEILSSGAFKEMQEAASTFNIIQGMGSAFNQMQEAAVQGMGSAFNEMQKAASTFNKIQGMSSAFERMKEADTDAIQEMDSAFNSSVLTKSNQIKGDSNNTEPISLDNNPTEKNLMKNK